MNQKQELIKAIKEDSSFEYELAEGLVIHTDWESDNLFLPAVIETESQYDEHEISNLLNDELGDVFGFQELEYSESDCYNLYYPVGLRFTSDELKKSEAWC